MHHRPSCICALPERYRLLDVLGEGGEGVACLVEDLASGGRLLTLKAVRGAGGGKVSRERLREIFLALSRLAHPGLARVRDFGRLPGATGLFFTADFVPGRPLLDWAASLEKEPSDALVFTIGAQALSVLSYLERKGIHHGDLKPQNIIIEDRAASGSAAAAASDDPGEPTAPGTPPRSSPRLFLIDFGAARLRDAAAENTSLATAAYLPPRWSLERESAISQDLYALGLTLLQLHAGRLPFPLGDESAQRAWHLTGQPASPRRWRPDVSPALDLLLQRLTHPDPAERFASAAAALEFIRQRVALPDLEDFSTGACPGFYGRREQVDAIASLPERRGPGIALLAGPPGIGKTRLLDAARLRARSAGRDAIAFASPADGAALAELEGRASRRPSERPAPAELRAAQLLAAVKPGTLILVDDAEKSPFPPLLREIVRQAAELRAARKPLACVLATADPAAVIERASLRARAIPVWTLGPLEPEARAEMAADFFAVETVPPALTGLLAEKSSTPAGDLRLLRAAAGAGARVDFLGELSLPPASLQKLASEADAPLADVRPAPPLDRQLDLLRFAEGWLTAPEMRALFGEFSSADWRRGLETLHSQGLVRRRGDGSDTRYSAETSGAPASGSSSVRKAGSRGAREPGDAGLRTPLLRAFEREGRRGLLASPDAWAVWGRHLAADGRPVEALRRLLRAARALERADRPDDARRLLEEIVRGEGDRQAPRFLLARLRLADVGRRLGRGRAALRDLGPIRKSHPLWFQRAARFRKGLLLAQIGEPESAVRQIERLLRLPVPRPATPASRWFFLEAEARLARLYLDAGRAGAGRRALDALLPRLEKAPAGAAVDRAARALGILASCELTHGDRDAAARHLETARALARAAGRPDLEMEPLNELAVLMAGSHRLDEALSLFEKLEELARRLSDPIGQIRALYNQGITCYRLQRLEDAEERHRRARRLSDALGPHAYSATVWIGLAVVLRERGRLTEALRLYRKVLRHLALARTADEAVARNNLGEVYLALGRLSRSLDERRRALDLARSTENRFLLGLALRSLGSSLWALGRASESRAALEECLAVESASADPRHLGSSHLFLGCQAAMEGDAPRAVNLLRRARTECRRAGDRAFAEAASLALLEALARRREPGPSRRRLARFLPQPGGAASVVWPVIERALRARLDLDRPTAREELLEALRDGAARGLVWQTFLATTAALGDPALPPGIAAELEDHRELLASVMTRRLDPDGVAVFRACWLRGMHPGRTLAPEAASSASTPQDAAGPPISAQQVALPEGSLLAGLDEFSAQGLDAALVGLLDRLRRATGSRRAWTIRLGEQKASFWTDRGTAARPLRLLREGGGVIERARRSGEIEEAGGGLLLATARSSSLLLFLERPPGGWSPAAEASARLRIAEAARLVHLLFRLQEAETALEGERAAHRETRDSLRQLTAALGRDKELIDTALISRRSELAEEVRRLGQTRFLREGPVHEPVARSRPMRELMSRLPRLAEGHLPILILGESGVGKDLLARWIHSISPRRKAPFLAEICSLPESLLESELFGFVRGAFTDAVRDQPGLFQRVNKGTLYLDEIADLSPALQSRLLRVIESRRVRPLGGDEEIQLDFRLISSSRCADPDELVARGLRRDLFYRLQGQTITVPPLRERPEEIPHLARELAARFAARANQPVPLISPEVLEKLTKHSWPGNVRELANEIERALLENPRELLPSLVLKEPRAAGRLAILPDIERGLRVARDNFERQIVAEALRRFHGNASAAARWLRVTRRHLGKLIEKHVLDLQAFKR